VAICCIAEPHYRVITGPRRFLGYIASVTHRWSGHADTRRTHGHRWAHQAELPEPPVSLDRDFWQLMRRDIDRS
jgi:hypothetical protein